MNLPQLENASLIKIGVNSLLIISDGFERRSLAWISSLTTANIFAKTVIFRHQPERESCFDEQRPILERITNNTVSTEWFNHMSPVESEFDLINCIKSLGDKYQEIYIDISVMSKLLILQLIESLKNHSGKLTFIYSEPESYSPTKEEFNNAKNNNLLNIVKYPTSGVMAVVQTPLLSSLTMQQKPTLIIAFLSFNEQLIRAIISSITVTNLYFINGVPPSLLWREKATQNIHEKLINDYKADNPLDINGRIERRTSTLDYRETVALLRDIYLKNFHKRRIILSPTGSKMQAIACGIVKACCQDIHIEYPTPESFFTLGFSSSEIKEIHSITFDNFSASINKLKPSFELC